MIDRDDVRRLLEYVESDSEELEDFIDMMELNDAEAKIIRLNDAFIKNRPEAWDILKRHQDHIYFTIRKLWEQVG